MLQKIIESLSSCEIVISFEILEYFNEETTTLIKVKVNLCDGSMLYIREFIRLNDSKYSYHWQTSNGELILRWDNAPHFQSISTFPHHVHRGDEVYSSFRVFIDEVLHEIEKYLNQ